MVGLSKKSKKCVQFNTSSKRFNHDFDGKKINVLVCCGNMGNAKPNEESLNAWIPENGNCGEILEDPNYPIMFDEDDNIYENNNEYGKAHKSYQHEGSEENGSGEGNDNNPRARERDSKAAAAATAPRNQRFDIIAIGMQESTFGGDKAKDGTDLTEPADTSFKKTKADAVSEQSLAANLAHDYQADSDRALNPRDQEKSIAILPTDATSATQRGKSVGNFNDDATTVSATRKKKKGGITKKITSKTSSAVTSLYADRDYQKEGVEEPEDTAILHGMIQQRLKNYRRIVSYQRGEMRLMIFVSNSTCSVEVSNVKAQNTGVAGLANKGGIAAEIIANGTTRLGFVTAHLEAHEGITKYKMRCESVSDIFAGTKKFGQHRSSMSPDISLTSHFCFFMGDLNFRTRFPGHNNGVNTETKRTRAISDASFKVWQDLNQWDELQLAIQKKECFCGFETLYCNFPPTFKVEREENYNYKENRTPSYTDRILWKTGHMLENQIEPLCYEPIDTFSTSDHKPMRGAFSVALHDRVVFSEEIVEKSRKSFNRRPAAPLRRQRNSMIDLFSREPRENATPTAAAAAPAKELDLHLFISDIQCELKNNCTSNGQPPNPYACIISSPEECIQVMQKKTFLNQFFSRIWSSATKKTNDGRKIEERTSFGWPRNEKIKGTYKPDWTGGEIRCILQTKDTDGKKLSSLCDENGKDLSGAILHMSLFNHKSSQSTNDDELLGTFPFNLHHLLKNSKEVWKRRQQEEIQRQLLMQQQQQVANTQKQTKRRSSFFAFGKNNAAAAAAVIQQNATDLNDSTINDNIEVGLGATLPRSRSSTNGPRRSLDRSFSTSLTDVRRSVLGMFGTTRNLLNLDFDSADMDINIEMEGVNMTTMQVEGPLLRNGIETGKITCTVETYWLDKEESQKATYDPNINSLNNFMSRNSYSRQDSTTLGAAFHQSSLSLSGTYGDHRGSMKKGLSMKPLNGSLKPSNHHQEMVRPPRLTMSQKRMRKVIYSSERYSGIRSSSAMMVGENGNNINVAGGESKNNM